MTHEVIREGFVSLREEKGPTACAAGPRCVVRPDGSIVCTFLAQAALGGNDFKPMITRSTDQGATWTPAREIWPEVRDRFSIFGSISSSPAGDCFFYGMRTPIGIPGEPAWSEATQGLKQNELVWSRSADGGVTWSPFAVIPMPQPGSAEAAGAMCATRDGELVCCYAPYRTFDPAVKVVTHHVIALVSRDQGRTWQHRAMLTFPQPDAMGAESWVVELSDGRLIGAGWHVHGSVPQPNPYAISHDKGASWTPTRSTGIRGQSVALLPLPDGRVAMVYNQRQQRDPGVWLAVARPTDTAFGIEYHARVWSAEVTTQRGKDDALSGWTDFAFGEPSVTRLKDNSLLVVFWCLQPSGRGIRYVRLKF